MAGTALQNFTKFMNVTGPQYITSPDKFLNEAVKTTYSLSYFLKGKGMDAVLQSGDTIKDFIMFDEQSTAQNYNPNETFTWSQPQVGTEISIPWRFTVDHMSWTKHEIELNINSNLRREHQMVQYKRLRKTLEARVATSMANFYEQKFWQDAAGQQGLMETANTGSSAGEQYSIPAFITEDTTNYHANSWTTIMQVNPANEDKWRNQVETYDYDDPDDSDGDNDGLFDAFDNMIRKVHYVPPGFQNEHFEPDARQQKFYIFCSRGGINQYSRLLRASNDTLISKQDAAYMTPTFGGIPLVYVSHLDSATITWDPSTSATAATETNANPDGYRYFWLNTDYITPIWHNTQYFFKMDPFFLPNQPFTYVCPIDSWWNMFMHSRQRHGIVAPQ